MNRRTFLTTPALLGVTPFAFAQPKRAELPFRQIHLDFHTSELITDVGADWDAQAFLATLQQARVNSVNVFAKCHHGYAYYDTKIAVKHPALKVDLLGDMVRVCRPAGIAVNYYYSLVWDVLQSRKHPEWHAVGKDGSRIGGPPGDAWPWLCLNTPYFDLVLAENREILERYPVDGSWFDILKQRPDGCFCRWCIAERKKLGLGDSADDIFRHNKIVAKRVERKLTELTHAKYPGAATFFNSRLVIGVRDELEWYSHIEIESLPTGGWGYTHFQQRVRYMRTLGKDIVGMTGRFHKSWGDFGGIKNQAALEFECLNFLANGAKVCVGDQLHPRGRLDPVTYSRIAKVYRKVEALEPWCQGARAVADIGVMSAAATNPEATTTKVPPVDQGFTNLLVELHQQFNILDLDSDLAEYKLVILPDEIRPSPRLIAALEAYLAKGGALLFSGRSLLAEGRFALPGTGVRHLGPAKFMQEYMLLKTDKFPGIDEQPYFLYQAGESIAAEPGAEVLATYGHPYFDRAPDHFSSHKQTPIGSRTGEPLIVRKGRVVYIANPFFRSYGQDGYGIQKQVVAQLIRDLLPEPAIRVENVPSTAQVTLLRQPSGQLVAHLLHYPLTRRAPDIDIIEEAGWVNGARVQVRCERKPSAVLLVPQRIKVLFDYQNGYASFDLPPLLGHQAVAIK
jgi:hypothetical protein